VCCVGRACVVFGAHVTLRARIGGSRHKDKENRRQEVVAQPVFVCHWIRGGQGLCDQRARGAHAQERLCGYERVRCSPPMLAPTLSQPHWLRPDVASLSLHMRAYARQSGTRPRFGSCLRATLRPSLRPTVLPPSRASCLGTLTHVRLCSVRLGCLVTHAPMGWCAGW
jgi:hypothetical protein